MEKVRQGLINNRGFSFIELLVAVVVIGILASMAVPRVIGVMGDAKEKACEANVKSLESALERYYAKEGRYPDSLGDLVPDYIKEIPQCPVAPKDAAKQYSSAYTGSGQDYTFNHTH